MATPIEVHAEPWHATRRFRVIALSLLIVVLTIEGYVAVFKRENDFVWHVNLGQRFLDGDPFGAGHDWYTLPRAMLDAAPALLPMRVARAVWYGMAAAALFAIYCCWDRMTSRNGQMNSPSAIAAGLISVGLLLSYVLRDLDECGLQILLLLMLSAAGWAIQLRRPLHAGFWLATAAVYKSTPVIFLPLLLWKRQWRAAAAMTAIVALWAVAPAAWLGWEKTVASHKQWGARVARLMGDESAYPSLMESEEPKPQNQSLQAAVARYLESHPAGHPLHVDHPAFAQFGRLDPANAKRGVTAAVLLLAVILAIRFRRSWRPPDESGDFAAVWAATCLLCALLSPLCWKQHLVLALPCAFLVLRDAAERGSATRWRLGALLSIAAIVNLTRHGIVGRELSVVLLTYKLDTFAMLLLMGLALARERNKSVSTITLPTEQLSPIRAAA